MSSKNRVLTPSAMLWWVRKGADDFTLKPFGGDDGFQLVLFHGGIRRYFTGALNEVITAAYEYVAEDNKVYHQRVRDLFAVSSGDMPASKLTKLDKIEVSSS